MKPCIVIPCYNHPATVAMVAASAQPYAPVIVVDDGSTVKLPALPGCTFLRLEKNSGKAAALRQLVACSLMMGALQCGFGDAVVRLGELRLTRVR